MPGTDIARLPEEIKPYAEMLWTPEVIQAYKEISDTRPVVF